MTASAVAIAPSNTTPDLNIRRRNAGPAFQYLTYHDETSSFSEKVLRPSAQSVGTSYCAVNAEASSRRSARDAGADGGTLRLPRRRRTIRRPRPGRQVAIPRPAILTSSDDSEVVIPALDALLLNG
jgi:hypothetical protein